MEVLAADKLRKGKARKMIECFYSEKGENKVFWFEETADGHQKLVRPDGTCEIITDKPPAYEELNCQALAGWQRAMLLMREYGVWDATAFAATMSATLAVKPYRGIVPDNSVYVFATPQAAEKSVYPYLTVAQVKKCRRYVDEFYANPNLQAAWPDFILHSVCLKIEKGKYKPISIASIGCGESVLGRYIFEPVWIGEKDSAIEIYERMAKYTSREINY